MTSSTTHLGRDRETTHRLGPRSVVAFDYGEVISYRPSTVDRQRLLLIAGRPDPVAFDRAYWGHRDALDLGHLTPIDYWRRIAAELDQTWEAVTLNELWRTDFASWLHLNSDVIDIISSLRAEGTRLALLSNAGTDFDWYYRTSVLSSLFDDIFTSSQYGALKPSRSLFQSVIGALSIDATDLTLIDDRSANVQAAAAMGTEAHLFTDAARLRRFLDFDVRNWRSTSAQLR